VCFEGGVCVCVCVDQWSLFFFMASLSDDEIRCKIQLKYSNAAPQNSGIVLKRDTSGITHTHTHTHHCSPSTGDREHKHTHTLLVMKRQTGCLKPVDVCVGGSLNLSILLYAHYAVYVCV